LRSFRAKKEKIQQTADAAAADLLSRKKPVKPEQQFALPCKTLPGYGPPLLDQNGGKP
jgi:hypothetical protein